jgi:hypothetical protein
MRPAAIAILKRMSASVRAMACAVLFSAAAWTFCSAQTPANGKQLPKSTTTVRLAGPAAPDPKPAAPSSVDTGPMEKLVYSVEWRLIRAGTVTIETHPSEVRMRLESAGLVASLFKVDDLYEAHYDAADRDQSPFCATSMRLESMEGKRHHEAQVTYDRSANRAHYIEHDLATNETLREATVDLPPCASDTLGGLARLRRVAAPVLGKAIEVPISDGRHTAMVKAEPQEREEVKVPAGTFKAIRYEAFLMNGVIYPRKGRVWIWFTDDPRRLPVQIRFRTGFPVGTVTLELEKQEGP